MRISMAFFFEWSGDRSLQGTIAVLRKVLARKNRCLALLRAQLLALSIGAKTYKLRFGHRGKSTLPMRETKSAT